MELLAELQPGLAPSAGCSRSIMSFVQLSRELLPLTEGSQLQPRSLITAMSPT